MTRPLPPVSPDEHREALLDAALEDSFPASDPPSMAQPHDPQEESDAPARR